MKKLKELMKHIVKGERIVWDVDGVLLQFDPAFRKYMDEHNIKYTKNDYDYGRKDTFELIKRFWKTKQFANLEQYPNAKEVFNKIAEKNMCIVVSSIFNQYENKRLKNLEGFDYIKFIPKMNKVKFISEVIKPDICIEDKPSNIKGLYEAGIKVYFPDLNYIPKDYDEYGVRYKNLKKLEKLLLNNNKE